MAMHRHQKHGTTSTSRSPGVRASAAADEGGGLRRRGQRQRTHSTWGPKVQQCAKSYRNSSSEGQYSEKRLRNAVLGWPRASGLLGKVFAGHSSRGRTWAGSLASLLKTAGHRAGFSNSALKLLSSAVCPSGNSLFSTRVTVNTLKSSPQQWPPGPLTWEIPGRAQEMELGLASAEQSGNPREPSFLGVSKPKLPSASCDPARGFLANVQLLFLPLPSRASPQPPSPTRFQNFPLGRKKGSS